MIVPTETYFLTIGAPVVALVIVAVVLIMRKRRSSEGHSPTFLPPIIGVNNIPKEQTYIVPREWKPSGGGVYTPLSIPIHEGTERSGNNRPSWSPVSLIRALPPQMQQSV